MDISLIMPLYNVEEEYLRKSLDSVLEQGMENIEVIIVDDGSTDGSGIIADEYASKYSNFKVIHRRNKGPGRARNTAIRRAKGKYLFFMDSDDVLVPGILQKMLQRAIHDESDVTICNVARFNSDKVWESYNHKRIFRNIKTVTTLNETPALLYDTISCDKLIKRDLWKKNRLRYPEKILYEDIPVMTELLIKANKISVIRDFGYLWRSRDEETSSITQRRVELSNFEDRITSLQMLDRILKKKKCSSKIEIEKQVKILKLDFKMYINLCMDQSNEDTAIYAEKIRSYIRKSISNEAFEKLNPIDQAIYKALLDDNLDNLRKITKFRKTIYPGLPYYEQDSKVRIHADKELFDTDMIDITSSIKFRNPRTWVRSCKVSKDGCIKLIGHLYFPKINISEKTDQKIKAYLVDETSGEEIKLKARPCEAKWLSEEKRTVRDELTGSSVVYDYTWTGFSIYINPMELNKSITDGIILLKYKNRFNKGTAILKNVKDKVAHTVSDEIVEQDGKTISLKISVGEVIKVNVDIPQKN